MILFRLFSSVCLAFVLGVPLAKADDGKPAAAPASNDQLSFRLLATAVHKEGRDPAFPADLKKMDGKKVQLTGFIAPYDNPDSMTKFMLTEAAVGCYFCNPPEENGVVFVRLESKAKPINMDNETVTVEGTLHFMGHNKDDEEAQGFLFTIDDAKVVAKK